MHHVIQSQQFNRKLLQDLFETADRLQVELDDSMRGKIMASLFYEPSTRTRLSFESAMVRLGGNVLSTENAKDSSSNAKGETIEDTIRVVGNYCDVIVLRHHEEGSAKRAASVSKVPIINAGDGGGGQHPTQALMDLYTINREFGKIDGIHIAFVGNLKYYRSSRSLAYFLGKYDNVKITFVSAPELQMKGDVKEYLRRHNVRFEETEDIHHAMETADIVYQTRVAKEWIKSEEEYEKLKERYIITRPFADSMRQGSIIIHPLPRVGEITPEVDDSPHAVYFKQAKYGLYVRMALLKLVLA